MLTIAYIYDEPKSSSKNENDGGDDRCCAATRYLLSSRLGLRVSLWMPRYQQTGAY